MKEHWGTGDIEGLCCNRYIYIIYIYNMYNMYMVYMYNNKFELVWLCLSILVIKEGWITVPVSTKILSVIVSCTIHSAHDYFIPSNHYEQSARRGERSRLFSSSLGFFFLHSGCSNVFLNLAICFSIAEVTFPTKKKEKKKEKPDCTSVFTRTRESTCASLC